MTKSLDVIKAELGVHYYNFVEAIAQGHPIAAKQYADEIKKRLDALVESAMKTEGLA